ncbi:MAG: hypothetical protein AAF478_05505 [Pseudomonadota bacterium]
MYRLFITLTALAVSVSAQALDLEAGRYTHKFKDGTCGTYTVGSANNFKEYQYGPCGKAPTYKSQDIAAYEDVIQVGVVIMTKVKVSGKCFSGKWKFQKFRDPNKKFCRQ